MKFTIEYLDAGRLCHKEQHASPEAADAGKYALQHLEEHGADRARIISNESLAEVDLVGG